MTLHHQVVAEAAEASHAAYNHVTAATQRAVLRSVVRSTVLHLHATHTVRVIHRAIAVWRSKRCVANAGELVRQKCTAVLLHTHTQFRVVGFIWI